MKRCLKQTRGRQGRKTGRPLRFLITAAILVLLAVGAGCADDQKADTLPVDITGHWQIVRSDNRKDLGPAQMIIKRQGSGLDITYWNPRTSARFDVKGAHWDGTTLVFTTVVTGGGSGRAGFWNKKTLTLRGPDRLQGKWENSDGFSGEYTFRRIDPAHGSGAGKSDS